MTAWQRIVPIYECSSARERNVRPQAANRDDDQRGYPIPDAHHSAVSRIPPMLHPNEEQAADRTVQEAHENQNAEMPSCRSPCIRTRCGTRPATGLRMRRRTPARFRAFSGIGTSHTRCATRTWRGPLQGLLGAADRCELSQNRRPDPDGARWTNAVCLSGTPGLQDLVGRDMDGSTRVHWPFARSARRHSP
jgi:hypothetical protein